MSTTKITTMYRLYRTAFHNGGLISRHRSREAAERAKRRFAMQDCICGCSVIVAPDEPEPPTHVDPPRDPYRAAR